MDEALSGPYGAVMAKYCGAPAGRRQSWTHGVAAEGRGTSLAGAEGDPYQSLICSNVLPFGLVNAPATFN